jgi:dTMP kinase
MKRLKKLSKEVKVISFPDYSTRVGKLIKDYLEDKTSFNPEVRQCLYVANRWERVREIESWINDGYMVIADRYVPSGLVYGLANGLELEWMLNLEKGLPIPDLIIVVDVSVNIAFDRETSRDVYERNKPFLTRVRQEYLRLAQKFNWVVVDGERAKHEVSNQIWEHVTGILD